MVFPANLISAGAGSSIPISAGGATGGDLFTDVGAFGPVNIGGVFGDASSGFNVVPIAIATAVVVVAFLFLRRK